MYPTAKRRQARSSCRCLTFPSIQTSHKRDLGLITAKRQFDGCTCVATDHGQLVADRQRPIVPEEFGSIAELQLPLASEAFRTRAKGESRGVSDRVIFVSQPGCFEQATQIR